MTRRARWVFSVLAIVLGVLVAAGLVYDRFYRIPRGPVLPPDPPDRTYAAEAIALNNRAVELQAHDPEGAVRLYDEAVRIEPDYDFAYANKAQLLFQQKRYGDALVCYEKLEQLTPRCAEYYVGRACCLHHLKRDGEMQESLLKALSAYNYRTDGSAFRTRLNRALVLFLLGREQVARRELAGLEGQHADSVQSRMVGDLRKAMDDAEHGDRRSVLGLD